MAHDEDELPLLNIYEIEVDGKTKHYIGFLDSVLAGARGIDTRSLVGEFTPTDFGGFDPTTFSVNPEFLAAVVEFMNGQTHNSPGLAEGALSIPGERLYIVDPRNSTDPKEDPPDADVLGYVEVDDDGVIIPGSFCYHDEHTWFNPKYGLSGLFLDRLFYDWLNPVEPK
ncbi:MAG: hypothetical protein ABI353_22710 [Isosphaeraceae bacterium]